MRIKELMLTSFGPFTNRHVRFAPGMTVIAGPNEAGKSTIHAGLYAAICGIRRGKGAPRREDQAFTDRHKPWSDAKSWEAAVVLELDDGRRVQLTQLLDGNGRSRCVDQSGTDMANQIMNEGSPDASRWLGLDRRSFRATGFVRQADVLEVLSDAQLLQGHLQQAAAGSARDETAALALSRMDEWQREHVGLDRANSGKPLRRAKDQLASAEAVRRSRYEREAELDGRVAAAKRAAEVADDLAGQVAELEANVAMWAADEQARKLHRAQDLAQRFPNGAPATSPDDETLLTKVVQAVHSWSTRPSVPQLSGPSSVELGEQLAHLPDVPEGDITPHESVNDAMAKYDRALLTVELHDGSRPTSGAQPTATASEAEIAELIKILGQPDPMESRRGVSAQPNRGEDDRRPRSARSLGFGIAGSLVVAGLVATASGISWLALLLFLLAVVSAGAGIRSGVRQGTGGGPIATAVGPQDAQSAAQQSARRRAAEARVTELGLPPDLDQLRSLADSLASTKFAMQGLAQWELRRSELTRLFLEVGADLSRKLLSREAAPMSDIPAMYSAYVRDCGRRNAQAVRAAQRATLAERLVNRDEAEREAATAVAAVAAAESSLRDAAKACGLPEGDSPTLHQQLSHWLERRQDIAGRRDLAQQEWIELQTLLDGRALAELTRETGRSEAEARRLGAGLRAPTKRKPPEDAIAVIQQLRTDHEVASRQAAELAANAHVAQESLPSTKSVETAFNAAVAELARVEGLQRTLSLAREFLERAQDRVHLAVAPLLQATLDAWLPRITNGRYVDSLVDPETLKVRLRSAGGHLRDAQLLSHGTMEQAYLLLRMAITDHVTRGRESCPLILDDVVIQSDSERAHAVLRLLHELSASKQIVLFTVSNEAAVWASQNLREPQDRFEQLDVAVASA